MQFCACHLIQCQAIKQDKISSITSALMDQLCQILSAFQHFGKHCSCHLQGEWVLLVLGSLA
jgi:hypothetical protein